MNTIRRLNCTFVFLMLIQGILPVTLTAQAQSQDSEQNEQAILALLQERDREIKRLLDSENPLTDATKEALRAEVNDMIDFRSMGEAALGRYWSDLSEEQKAEFVDTFARIVRLQSLADVDVYRAAVTYDRITVVGDSAHVVTTTTYKDVPTPVEYTLKASDSSWKATDIILDEVSTVDGYARSFQSLIRKRGFDTLMARLRDRLSAEEDTGA